MSLQIWLPFNGNLDNFGLNTISVAGTPSYDNNGKIGACLQSQVTLSNYATYLQPSHTNSISIACWIKSSSCDFIIACSAFELSCSNSFVLFRLGDGNTNTYAAAPSIKPLADTWSHIVGVWNADSKQVLCYLNGELVASTQCPNNINFNTISASCRLPYNGTNVKINDLRIYDHALSAKEVKELAKGLVLHYRLAGPGQENLVTSLSAGGQTSIDGTYAVHTSRTNSDTYFYANLSSSLNPGDKVTVSCDVSGFASNDYQWNFTFWSQGSGLAFWLKNGHCNKTFTVPSGVSASNRIIFDDNGSINGFTRGDSIIYIKNFKIERGSVQTPWCPAPGDALYSAMGYDNNVEYDCAGYQRNGTKSGTITWDVDSPRYTTSYKFNSSTNSGITIPTLSCITNNGYQTLSCWFKTSGLGTGMMLNGLICLGYGDSLFLDGSGCVYFRIDNGRDLNAVGTTESYSDNKWHLATVTYDGTSAKIYVDGKLKNTFSRVMSNRYVSSGSFQIGTEANNPPAYMYNGNISDVRIYATALSAEDIAELYHSAVIVDNTGKNYAYEYFEAN